MTRRPARPTPRFRPFRRAAARLPILGAAGTLGFAAACADIKERVQEATTPPAFVDARWQADSTLLASDPDVLYRVVPSPGGPVAVPLASLGGDGLRILRLGNRGWRALDLQQMQGGATLHAVTRGRTGGTARVVRGMWEGGQPLDSLPGCGVIIPAARVELPAPGVTLLTTRPRPPLAHAGALGEGALREALALIPTLVTPTLGVRAAQLGRYRREVFQVPSATGPTPSVVVVYDDPEPLPDTLSPVGQRPRHMVIVLDKGIYGFKATHSYSTLGTRRTPPRLRFLDAIDLDGDGLVELLFGTRFPEFPLYTTILDFKDDVWKETLVSRRERCQGN